MNRIPLASEHLPPPSNEQEIQVDILIYDPEKNHAKVIIFPNERPLELSSLCLYLEATPVSAKPDQQIWFLGPKLTTSTVLSAQITALTLFTVALSTIDKPSTLLLTNLAVLQQLLQVLLMVLRAMSYRPVKWITDLDLLRFFHLENKKDEIQRILYPSTYLKLTVFLIHACQSFQYSQSKSTLRDQGKFWYMWAGSLFGRSKSPCARNQGKWSGNQSNQRAWRELGWSEKSQSPLISCWLATTFSILTWHPEMYFS